MATNYLDVYFAVLEFLKESENEVFLKPRTAKAFVKALREYETSLLIELQKEQDLMAGKMLKENIDGGKAETDPEHLDPTQEEIIEALEKEQTRKKVADKVAKELFGKDKRRTLTNTAKSILQAKDVWRSEPHAIMISDNQYRHYYSVIYDNKVEYIDQDKDEETFNRIAGYDLETAKEMIGIPKQYKYVFPIEYYFARVWLNDQTDEQSPAIPVPAPDFGLYASFPESPYNAFTGLTRESVKRAEIISSGQWNEVEIVRHRYKRSKEADHYFQLQLPDAMIGEDPQAIISAMEPKAISLWKKRGIALKVWLYINNRIVQYEAGKEINIKLSDYMTLCGLKDEKTARESLIEAGDLLRANIIYEGKNGDRLNTELVQEAEWITGHGKKSGALNLVLSDKAWSAYRNAREKQDRLAQYPNWIYRIPAKYQGALFLAVEFYNQGRINATKDNKGTWRKRKMPDVFLIMGLEPRERKRAIDDCVKPFWNNKDYLEKNSPLRFSLLYSTGEKITEEDERQAREDYDFLSSLTLRLEENMEAEPDYTGLIVKAEEYQEKQGKKTKKKDSQ